MEKGEEVGRRGNKKELWGFSLPWLMCIFLKCRKTHTLGGIKDDPPKEGTTVCKYFTHINN